MLTGFGDNANRLAQEANLSKFSDQYGIAIVVLEGSNLFYVDSNPMTRYSTLVGEELIEITRKAFRLSDKREDTFIGGMSMGGFGAFYNGLKYSDVFSKIAMDAPAFDIYGVTVPGTELPAFPTQFLDGIFESKQNYEDTFNYLGYSHCSFQAFISERILRMMEDTSFISA